MVWSAIFYSHLDQEDRDLNLGNANIFMFISHGTCHLCEKGGRCYDNEVPDIEVPAILK